MKIVLTKKLVLAGEGKMHAPGTCVVVDDALGRELLTSGRARAARLEEVAVNEVEVSADDSAEAMQEDEL